MSLLSPSLAGGFITTSTTWKQMFYNFMATVTILSDVGAQEKKICHCFYFFPSIYHEVIGPDAMILFFV